MLRGRSDGDHIIQRPRCLQPGDDNNGAEHGGEADGAGNVPVTRRRKGQKLDVRVRVLVRTLLVVVGVAGSTSSGAEKVPSSTLRHVIHLLFWPRPILHHRYRVRARCSGLALPLRRRSLQHCLCSE